MNPELKKIELTLAYAKFYEQYLSEDKVLEGIINQKTNIKSWFLKAGTDEIFIVDKESIEDFLKSMLPTQASNGLVLLQEVDVNKIFDDRNVLTAAIDFIRLPAYRKTDRVEAIEFIAEAAKEVFNGSDKDPQITSNVVNDSQAQSQDEVEESKLHNNLSTPKEVLKEINALLDGIVSDEPALTKEVLQQSKLFDFVVYSITNFEVGEGLDKITLLNSLVKKDIISSEQFILLASKLIDLERNSIFSDPEAIELFLNQLSQSYVSQNNFNYVKEETLKEFFNKVSKIVLEQQNGKLIVLLGGILSQTNIV
jgi:hypothetical protein